MTAFLDRSKRLARRCVEAAAALVALCLIAAPGPVHSAQPAIQGVARSENAFIISANIPPGYRHAVLEAGGNIYEPIAEPLIAGGLDGNSALVTFLVPDSTSSIQFFRIRVGPEDAVPPSTYSGPAHFLVEYTGGPYALSEAEKVGHVLNRLTYGPSPGEIIRVETLGLVPFIEGQLDPASIDESGNTALLDRESELFILFQPGQDTPLVREGDTWKYFKGSQAPPASWATEGFDDTAWLQGPSGFGYGDDDDATELDDMLQTPTNTGYLTLFARRTFNVASVEEIDALILSIDFDDGFVAYLNGTEVARENVDSTAFDEPASGSRESGSPATYDLTDRKALLHTGLNTLAVQLHNVNRTSSDASLIPELLSREYLPFPPQVRIRDIESLQELIHIRGIYSGRQLQAILAEFWENHFTTDYDKVAEYFEEELRNSDARPAMGEDQAAAEAAHAEYREYQFFYDNALGNFGDLLLYSATSPAQLIYLDNVLNVKDAPNENYAREILELFAFGVDNRYTQQDIEELARCFTGWGIRKVAYDQAQPFPASARTPPTEGSVQFQDTVLLDLGPGWKYFKGTAEPSPDLDGEPTLAWTEPGFADDAWLTGITGIGYGDGDDATVLSDMRNNYLSVYARREFMVTDPAALDNLLLDVDYDDGFIAYINGVEIARSRTMEDLGTASFDTPARGNREAGESQAFSLAPYLHLLKPAPEVNILAIQAHNVSLSSSDFSLRPRLLERILLPGSIENGDLNGLWTFRFIPEEHDTGAKTLFPGTPYEINVPAGRTGIDGLRDAVDIIDGFVDHPSVSEFICLKLVNKFVSDEISLVSYKDRTAPPGLLALMDDAVAAWHSTTPAGNIRTVMQAILTPQDHTSHFWSRDAYRAKIKTAVEFINSTARAIQVDVSGTDLPDYNEELGMTLFTRDDPDGWSELGTDWMDTGTLLARIKFAQSLTLNRIDDVDWDVDAWLTEHQLSSAESIIDYFDQLLFGGEMPAANRDVLLTFANTDVNGAPLPLDPSRTDYEGRIRELVSLILSNPQWHYQ